MSNCEPQTKSFTVEAKEYPRQRSVIIPPLNFNGDTKESPRRRTITTMSSGRKIDSGEIIPPGSLILRPHTPPADDNPCDILNEKISHDIEKRRSGQTKF